MSQSHVPVGCATKSSRSKWQALSSPQSRIYRSQGVFPISATLTKQAKVSLFAEQGRRCQSLDTRSLKPRDAERQGGNKKLTSRRLWHCHASPFSRRPIYCPSDYLTSRHRSGRKTDQSCQAASLHCIFVKPEALPRQLFYLTLSWVRATAASGTPELIRRPPELDKPQAAACRCQC